MEIEDLIEEFYISIEKFEKKANKLFGTDDKISKHFKRQNYVI
jgi:hypothetical protein